MPLPADHPGLDPAHPVLLFDGECGLCTRSVRFLARHDRRGVFRFSPLQAPAAQRLLLAANAPSPLPDSMIIVDGGRCYVQSDAPLRMVRRLPFPWPALTVLGLPPRPWRDALYRLIARNRYKWFGKRDTCMTPTHDIAARFLH